jgi:FixJ family two-component response regulator
MNAGSIGKIVYVVAADLDHGASIARLLKRAGYSAEPFIDHRQLLERYSAQPADCVISDVDAGQLGDPAFAERLRQIDPAAAIFFMTALSAARTRVNSTSQHDGIGYLEKPIDGEHLLAAVGDGTSWSKRTRFTVAGAS